MKSILEKLVSHPYLKLIVAEIFMFWSWCFEGKTQIVFAVYLLILIDTVTGVIYAVRTKNVNSRDFSRSPMKCLIYFIMLLVSRIVDRTLPIPLASPIMDAFLVTTESVSILENFSKLGYPVPTFLVNKLKPFYETKQTE